VQSFVEAAFDYVGLDWSDYVVVDPRFYRPAEVSLLLGDCRKARKQLNWSYDHRFQDLVEEMVESDLDYCQRAGGAAPMKADVGTAVPR
jgi:GDPmannose 4,6-dehydratase